MTLMILFIRSLSTHPAYTSLDHPPCAGILADSFLTKVMLSDMVIQFQAQATNSPYKAHYLLVLNDANYVEAVQS